MMLSEPPFLLNYTSKAKGIGDIGEAEQDPGSCCSLIGSCTNSSSTNTTLNNFKDPQCHVITNLIISAIIVFINLSVIIVYWLKCRSLMRSPSSWLLVSLSFCDLLKGFGVFLVLLNHWIQFPDEIIFRRYRIFVDIYNTFVLENIVLHLCGLTLDRYLVMFRPYKYASLVTKASVVRFVSFSWLFSFSAASLQCFWLHNILVHNMASCAELETINEFEFWYSTTSFVVFLAVPVVLLGIAFTMMFFEVRYILRRTEHTRKTYYRQLRVLYVFALMYVSFAVLVLPYFSMRLAIDIKHRNREDSKMNLHVLSITVTLRNFNSIVNPLLYAGTDPKFKSICRKLLCRSDDNQTAPFAFEGEMRRLSKMSFEFNRVILQSQFLRTGQMDCDDSLTNGNQMNVNLLTRCIDDSRAEEGSSDNRIAGKKLIEKER